MRNVRRDRHSGKMAACTHQSESDRPRQTHYEHYVGDLRKSGEKRLIG